MQDHSFKHDNIFSRTGVWFPHCIQFDISLLLIDWSALELQQSFQRHPPALQVMLESEQNSEPAKILVQFSDAACEVPNLKLGGSLQEKSRDVAALFVFNLPLLPPSSFTFFLFCFLFTFSSNFYFYFYFLSCLFVCSPFCFLYFHF